MSVKLQDIDQLSINIAKGLIMDTVRKANSGHTGGPLSSLDYIYILFKECKYALADATNVSKSAPFPTYDLSFCSNLTVTSA